MSENAHHRKKQPEEVRRKLLGSAARLAVEHGLSSVSIQAVADAAGVTKGGLFHHFPSKQALIEAVCRDLLEQLDADVEAFMSNDKGGFGTFTRAYVLAVFSDRNMETTRHLAALSMSLMTDAGSNKAWDKWLGGRLARHAETDSAPLLQVVRLAADGSWFSFAARPDAGPVTGEGELITKLLALTEEPARKI